MIELPLYALLDLRNRLKVHFIINKSDILVPSRFPCGTVITHSITWPLAGSYPSPSTLGNSHKLPHNPEIMKNLQPTVQCREFDNIVEEL